MSWPVRAHLALLGAAVLLHGCAAPTSNSKGKANLNLAHPASAPRIAWDDPSPPAIPRFVEVHGLDAPSRDRLALSISAGNCHRFFTIRIQPGEQASVDALPPVSGRYEMVSDNLRFTPHYPWPPGLRLMATFENPEQRGDPVVSTLNIAARKLKPKTVVTAIYPSSTTLPENVLKFYVQFSRPMSRGNIYEHIKLRDDAGAVVELPFLEIDEELWSPDLTRLTLLIDPGRIKREVKPLEEIGPAILGGRKYVLTIDRSWLDGDGTPLRRGFEKHFRAVAPDRVPPDPALWKITPPVAGTAQPLRIRFTEPLDYALARRVIRVMDNLDQPVPGETSVSDHEMRWAFRPEKKWSKGRYRVVIDPILEDRAGNSVGRPFEVDSTEPVTKANMSVLEFTINP